MKNHKIEFLSTSQEKLSIFTRPLQQLARISLTLVRVRVESLSLQNVRTYISSFVHFSFLRHFVVSCLGLPTNFSERGETPSKHRAGFIGFILGDRVALSGGHAEQAESNRARIKILIHRPVFVWVNGSMVPWFERY